MKRFIENRPSSDTARRPLPPLAGNLLFLGALFAMSLLVMAIEKPLFLLWYHAQAAEASAAELALVVWNGLKLDQTVAGYITALPLLVVLAALWIPGRWSRSVLKGYLLVIAAVAATAFAANLALYEYWAFPLDSSVLQYLASPKEALASVTAGQLLLQLLVAAAVFGGMAWCYPRVLRLYDPARRSTHRAGSTLVLLLAAGVLFLPIRGGVSVATANVSKVYFSGRMFLNHAAVNPLFSFLSTLSDGDDALYEYEFFPEPERAAIFEPLRGDLPAGIGTDTLLRTRRPNVVLFLVESFGRSTVDERVGGEPVAPEFQRLKGEGVYFDNLFANSFRTDRGTVAVLSGFPAQTKMSVMKLPVKSQRLPSIARSLRREGYATSFYYGGDLNFTNTASYLYGTGFDRLTWQKDLHFDAPTSKWGYADDVVIDAFTDHVLAEAASQRPFFAAMLTLSSHEPFDVPFAKFDDPMLNAMAFTDACLGRFVERVRQTPVWKDLLVRPCLPLPLRHRQQRRAASPHPDAVAGRRRAPSGGSRNLRLAERSGGHAARAAGDRSRRFPFQPRPVRSGAPQIRLLVFQQRLRRGRRRRHDDLRLHLRPRDLARQHGRAAARRKGDAPNHLQGDTGAVKIRRIEIRSVPSGA